MAERGDMKNKIIGKILLASLLSASLLSGCAGIGDIVNRSADVENDEDEEDDEDGDEEEETGEEDEDRPVSDAEDGDERYDDSDPFGKLDGDRLSSGIDSEYRQLQLYSYPMYNYAYDSELDMAIAEAGTTHIELVDDDFPQLKEAIDGYSESKEAYVLGAEFEELEKEARDALPEMGDYPMTFYVKFDTTVLRADTVVTSLLTHYEDFKGGAHGTYYNYGVNFDSATGKELSIKDVVDEDVLDELPGIIAEALLKRYGSEVFYSDADTEEAIAETIKTYYGTEAGYIYSFGLGYEGITFYFQPYELAPYAAGSISATLKYEDYPGLVDKKYAECASDYFISLDADMETLPHSTDTCYAYLSGDDGWGTYEDLVINFNGKEFHEEVYGYSADLWIGSIGGINYLFANFSEDNDYENLKVYSLNSATGNVECCAEMYGGFQGFVPLDPYEFRIYDRGGILSTYSMYKNYYIGRDGSPVALEDFYYIDSELSLKTISDVEGEIRDDFEGKGQRGVIKSGEKLYFYATDGETWVDFKRNDGSFVRFEVDCSDYPQKVNGIDSDTIFDGIMFAG